MGQFYGTTGQIEEAVALAGTTLTIDASYVGKTIYTGSGSATTITVPQDSAVSTVLPFNIGDRVRIVQGAAGAVTVAAGSGATVNTAGAGGTPRTLRQQWSEAWLVKTAANTWRLSGDVKTS